MTNKISNIMMSAGLLLILCLISLSVAAVEWEPIEQCWERPTEKEDNTPLALTEIATYEIWYNEDNHGLNWELAWTVPNTVGCVTYTPQGTGGDVCFRGFTTVTYAMTSIVSNTVCHTPVEIVAPPSPPKPLNMIGGGGG